MSISVAIETFDINPQLNAVETYIDCGWTPNPTVGKRAVLPGWPNLTAEEVRRRHSELWPPGTDRGVGLLLGKASGGLCDADLDCAEARRAAPHLLPPTGLRWGRASAPDSHYGYRVGDPPAKAATRYCDPVTGDSLVELRSTGAQTCVPPTVLPTKDGAGGEPVVWYDGVMGEPAAVTAADLAGAVARVAAAALLARYWPATGRRHDAHLALAGGLERSGIPSATAEALVRAICAATGDDEVDDRVRCVGSTGVRVDSAGNTTGWPTLAKQLGEHGAAVVAAARKWLDAWDEVVPASFEAPTDRERPVVVHGVALTASFRKVGQVLVAADRGWTPLHRDLLNLDSEKARARYAESVLTAAWPDAATRPTDAGAELAKALLGFAADPPRADTAGPATILTVTDPYADPRPAALKEMDPDVVAEAEEMLRDPELIERVGDDIARIGIAGERKLATTIYLVATSVQLPRPLSAMVIGSTSSGKSLVITSVAELIPPESKVLATDMTANSLYYMAEGRLHHRLVVAGERSRIEDDHRAEAKRALREMLESQVLRKLVTVTTDGAPETITIVQRGPIAFLESTTNADVFEEDRNRCLSLYTDESPEQTRAILNLTARRAAGKVGGDVSSVVDCHHALQRLIPRCDVTIPFAEEIERGYPDHRVDARRAFRHLLQTVKAVALLHFLQRERDAAGNVIATRDDYRVAVDLAEVPLAVAVGALSTGARAFYGRLSAKITADQGFTLMEAVVATGCPRSSAHRHLTELTGACLVDVSRAGAGRADLWHRTSGAVPPPVTLPKISDGTGSEPATGTGELAPVVPPANPSDRRGLDSLPPCVGTGQ